MKKKILRGILIFFLLYCIWLGYQLMVHKTYLQEQSSQFQNEIQGVYHIHTTLSDGRKPPDEVIRIAGEESLDFIILTDHGNPNFSSLKEEGWRDGLLALSGSEISVNRGHLVAMGFKTDGVRFSQHAENAASQVARQEGFTIIAHPYSKGGWSWGDLFLYSGIEVINANTMAKKNLLLSLPYLPAFLIKPDYALVRMLDTPDKNLNKWDSLTQKHIVYAYFSSDAHFLYAPLFRLFRLHLLLEEPLSFDFEKARRSVYEGLKKGRFYNAVNAAAAAKGFRFYGMSGDQQIPMGDAVSFAPPLTLYVQTPAEFKREIRLIRNGSVVMESETRDLFYEIPGPGVYRVEVYLRERTHLGRQVPWIISNPIFIRD